MADENKVNKNNNFTAFVDNSNGLTKSPNSMTSKSGASKKLVIKNFKGKCEFRAAQLQTKTT